MGRLTHGATAQAPDSSNRGLIPNELKAGRCARWTGATLAVAFFGGLGTRNFLGGEATPSFGAIFPAQRPNTMLPMRQPTALI